MLTALRGRSPRRPSAPRRRPWARLALERLEDRTVPATVLDYGVLRFTGNFNLDGDGFYEGENTTLFGFTPVVGEAFKPLLSVNGTIHLPGPAVDQSKFSFAGDLDLFVLADQVVYRSPDNQEAEVN